MFSGSHPIKPLPYPARKQLAVLLPPFQEQLKKEKNLQVSATCQEVTGEATPAGRRIISSHQTVACQILLNRNVNIASFRTHRIVIISPFVGVINSHKDFFFSCLSDLLKLLLPVGGSGKSH